MRASEAFDRFRRSTQRNHEKPRIAIKRDELPRGDVARSCEVGSEPGDEDDEQPRQEHLSGVEDRLRGRDADTRHADLLRAGAIPVEEGLFSPDTSEHSESRGGIGAEGGQKADLVTLIALACLQRLDHAAE